VQKFLSRKFLVPFLVMAVNFALNQLNIPDNIRILEISIFGGLGALYITVEGVKDIITEIKKRLNV